MNKTKYRTKLADYSEGKILTIITCTECGYAEIAGVYFPHYKHCSEYAPRKTAMKVGQEMHIIHASYPSIEKAMEHLNNE
jgi:hypothetical protein